ncbi:MAG: response regulator [Lentisphaeria bacterium]|nr:response regulator [Lentisphaeria bacterium]
MTRSGFDVADKTFSGEERLANLLALSRGLFGSLRTLVQHVRTYNDLIEDEIGENRAAAEYLSRSQRTVARALSWLDAFEAGVSGSLDLEKIDLKPLLEGVVQRCRRIAPRELDMEIDPGPDPTIVEAAVFQLQDVLLEMLEWTIERLPEGQAAVRVRVAHCPLSGPDLALVRSPCAAGLYAAVTMGAEAAPFSLRQCRAFWEALVEVPVRDADTDLGLLHAYGVLRGHGGDLFFEAEGSLPCLTLVLPMEPKRKEMQVEPHLEDDSLYGSETILLVDDEDMIWDVIIDMLQELGYSVILAGNGLEAVEIYRENPGLIDLVMLDMVMPELDGHGAFFKLREIDPEVKVLLSSGYVSEEEARDVLEAGAVGFLQKPYRMVDLARRIRAIFGSSG